MNGQELSAIEPKEYQRRFIDFMSVVLEKPFGGNPFNRKHKQTFLQSFNQN